MSAIEVNNTAETITVPLTLIDADPHNRKVTLDADFVRSIQLHGVIQPVIVVPHPTEADRYQLVAGERRVKAAAKAGLTAVPAQVRHLNVQEAIELQAIENLHRQDLKPCEEARVMFRLVELGMTKKDLAARIAKSQKYVSGRLSLLELPADVRRRIDTGELTVEGGLALVSLVEHPDELAAVVEGIDEDATGEDVSYAVRSTLRDIEYQRELGAAVQRLTEAGVTVLENEGYQPRGYTRIASWGGVNVDAEAHEAEPCHAVIFQARSTDAAPVCTDRKRHAANGESPLKDASRQTTGGVSDEERERRRQEREAVKARGDHLATVLGGKVRKPDAVEFAVTLFIDEASASVSMAAGKLLGIEGDTTQPWSFKQKLGDLAESSEANRLRVTAALCAAKCEERLRYGTGEAVVRYYAWLARLGYELTPMEEARLVEAQCRLSEENVIDGEPDDESLELSPEDLEDVALD